MYLLQMVVFIGVKVTCRGQNRVQISLKIVQESQFLAENWQVLSFFIKFSSKTGRIYSKITSFTLKFIKMDKNGQILFKNRIFCSKIYIFLVKTDDFWTKWHFSPIYDIFSQKCIFFEFSVRIPGILYWKFWTENRQSLLNLY